MLLRPFLNDAGLVRELPVRLHDARRSSRWSTRTSTSSTTTSRPPSAIGAPIVAVFETHVQADHVSGLPALVERTGATAYLPAGAGVEFEHVALDDGERGRARQHHRDRARDAGPRAGAHAYVVADRRRGDEEPWLVFSGDSLLIGDVGRPDLHVAGDAPARRASCTRASSGCSSCRITSSCTRATTAARSAAAASPGNPFSSIGFERAHNPMLAITDVDAFAEALVADVPPPPAEQEAIVAAEPLRERRAPRHDVAVRLGCARTPASSPAGRAERARRRDGRPRAQRAAARRGGGVRPRTRPPRSSPSSSRSAWPRRSPTSAPACSPSGSAASGCSSSAGSSRCRCR